MSTKSPKYKVQIFHNILWASYKGAVFTQLYKQSRESSIELRIVQIAETDTERVSLGPPDLSVHQYPYLLLFRGTFHGVSNWHRASQVAKAQREERADCVVINSYNDLSSWVLLIQAKILGQKTVLSLDSTYYDHPRVWYKELIKKMFVRHCDGGFCYGTRSREYLQRLGMPINQVAIRCQAAPMEYLLSQKAKLAQSDWRTPVMSARPYFLYVGRLAPEKGLHLLLEQFALLAKESALDLLVVGSGPLDESLKAKAEHLKLNDRVRFLGPRRGMELVQLYLEAYYLVLPSTSEPWGLVVNEAFAMNCPALVSSYCGCGPDLITSTTGLIFEKGDGADLLGKLRIAASQIDARDAMGREAYARISGYTPSYAASQMLGGLLKFARRTE